MKMQTVTALPSGITAESDDELLSGSSNSLDWIFEPYCQVMVSNTR